MKQKIMTQCSAWLSKGKERPSVTDQEKERDRHTAIPAFISVPVSRCRCIARFSWVGGKSIAKERHITQPLSSRFVTSREWRQENAEQNHFWPPEMMGDERCSARFEADCVRRVPSGTWRGSPSANRIVRFPRFAPSAHDSQNISCYCCCWCPNFSSTKLNFLGRVCLFSQIKDDFLLYRRNRPEFFEKWDVNSGNLGREG